jgi:hypothetical protein
MRTIALTAAALALAVAGPTGTLTHAVKHFDKPINVQRPKDSGCLFQTGLTKKTPRPVAACIIPPLVIER